ncbi:serine protein kinase, partial [uncultured Gimesia sp.]|uniref:PrkA family serine protein kinase n=1 Tax=uncultured Gimesia sp. TaxID=1678688 RepID=UPI0026297794
MENGRSILNQISGQLNADSFQQEHWQGTFDEYLDLVRADPKVTRTAFQRVYDMVMSHGTYPVEGKKSLVRYRFFDDPVNDGRDGIFGLSKPLMELVNVFKSASLKYGSERRVLLLHGPVGSSKSTIARLLKQGLERYSRTEEGALYSFGWKEADGSIHWDPMNSDPLQLIPLENRAEICKYLNADRDANNELDYIVEITGEVCPLSRFLFNERLKECNGDWTKVMEQVVVKRIIFSEQDRIGIGTFQPKDEKNQDSTELTGDINYRKIAQYGSESDPRAFNFDGEFNVSNRGLIEFIEVLKLDVAFLYDLLGASQEHKIKPKKFAQTDIDTVIIGHTNEPEYRRLQSNEFMEALRDRTVKIDVPYVTKLSEEIKIYEKDYNSKRVRGKHIAPHTLEIAAMWAVLTRLETPKHHGLTLVQKMNLYNGKSLTGFTSENVEQLRKEAKSEGLFGISPRYVQDKISNALVVNSHSSNLNPFMLLNELEEGLKHHSLIANEELRDHYRQLITIVKEEYTDIVKNEVQRAIAADEEALTRLCGNYLDNVKAYTQKERVKNNFTGEYEEPDERQMRSIE